MNRTPSPFGFDHPDHPYQQMRRAGAENPFALTQEDFARIQQLNRAHQAFKGDDPFVAFGTPPSPVDVIAEAIEEDADEEGPAGEDCLCQHLTLLAAFTHQLQLQSHLLHFSYRGSNFLSIHGLLKEGYERHLVEFDSLLEAVQMMGRDTPATHKELLEILPAFEHAMSTDNCQLSNYRENLLQQRKMAQGVEKEAQEAREIGIANMLAEIDAAAAKAAWFVAATLKG